MKPGFVLVLRAALGGFRADFGFRLTREARPADFRSGREGPARAGWGVNFAPK